MLKIFFFTLSSISLISCFNDATSYRYQGANWPGTCATVRLEYFQIFINRDKIKVQSIYQQIPIAF